MIFNKLRVFASDTLIYGVSTVVGRFLTFLLTPLYTNYVSKSALGDTAYLYSLIAFINVLYSCGLDSAFFKYFRFSTSLDNKYKEYNCSIFAHAHMGIVSLSSLLTLCICIMPSTIAQLLRLDEASASIIVYAALIAFFDACAVVPFAALRMESRSKRFGLLKLSVIALNVVANLVLVVYMRMGIRGIFLAGTFSSFAGIVLLVPEFKRYLFTHRIRLDRRLFRELLQFGLPTIPAAVSAIMLQVIDRPILKLFVDSAAVGLYQANYRLGIPMMMAVTIFEYAWKPFYLRETSGARTRKQRHIAYSLLSRILTYFTIACGIVFLVAGLLIEFAVRMPFVGGRFIHPSYWSGLSLVPIVLGGYFCNGLYINFAASVYIRKRTRYLPRVTGASALANIALNLALIPLCGIWGAAWATLGAYMLSAILMYCITRRIYPLRYEWKRILTAVLLCILIFGAAHYTTEGMSTILRFTAKVAWILTYPLALAGLGFFREEEQALFTRK
ncbi:MAG: polysaccharide biosynthesis C-terminal domain-containing protein [Bacteroidota bacterium]|nr:polysaccharide biosynthesis C-terminal domain-containing protein [Candidatus Kapabacteria bacterium]MDW8218981.1 polysaccharide biosynthesis C-terminal domain-containing protein [Bacteroidota bacterium]